MSADLQSCPLKCIVLTSKRKKVLSREICFFQFPLNSLALSINQELDVERFNA